jgi:hypothetical protein
MLLAALSAGTNTKDSFNLCLILENNRLFDWLGIKDLYSNPWVQKQVQKFNTFTGIYRPTKMFRCSDLGSVVLN